MNEQINVADAKIAKVAEIDTKVATNIEPKADTGKTPVSSQIERSAPRQKVRRKKPWSWLSYVAFVVLPTLAVGLYYAFMSSDHYVVSTQFSVRGSNSSPLALLGLNALPGVATQNDDSYIVKNYIESRQVIADIQQKHSIDLRDFYSKAEIDPLYRVKSDISLEQFEMYWRWMTAVEFNSTTGSSTLVVTAFSQEDARKISELAIDVAEQLVNNLSRESRNVLISTARTEVERSEKRLSAARTELMRFRNREQAVSPEQIASVQTPLLASLENQLADLKIRKSSLSASITDKQSPALRIIDRQIEAFEKQLIEQRQLIGSGDEGQSGDADSLSLVIAKYSELAIEEQFATDTYRAAMTSLGTADAEAQRQQRYFATYVTPYTPDATLYPMRFLNTFLTFVTLTVGWLIAYLLIRSVYDHAI